MNLVFIMVPAALLLSSFFLFAFVRVVASGQYDDLETPAHRILLDDVNSDPANEVQP